MMRTAYDLVRMAADRHPQRPALVDDRSPRRLGYGELIAAVDEVAAGFAARGVGRGSRVVTALPNLFDHCLALLALQRLAAVPALINFRLGHDDVATLAERAGAQAAVVLPDPELVAALRHRLPPGTALLVPGARQVDGAEPFSDCSGSPAALPDVPRPDPEEESFLFYTSGTTGLPKAVVLPHRCNEPRVTWLSTMLGLTGSVPIRALGVSPLSHAIGFHGVFLATLAFGGTFYTLSAFEPEAAMTVVETHRLNYIFTLPTIYAALLAAPGYRPERLRSLTTVYWGGAAMPASLLERLQAEWPARFGHIYGTTETMCALVNATPEGQPDRLFPAYGSRVRIVRTEEPGAGTEVAVGEQGELLVDGTGDAIFSGYLGLEEETAAKLRDGWYWSGDAAVRDDDGAIRLCGRLDDLIRSGGEFIQPEEVETCLLAHPAIAACAVVGIADERWGQLAVAAVVPAAGIDFDPLDADRHCRESSLANFKRPRAYLPIEELPMSAGGKLQRKMLRRLAARAAERVGAAGAPELLRIAPTGG